ncbi:MAG TPA: hypothetical protein VIZ62_05650 [Nitrososphaeraceae archaeon]
MKDKLPRIDISNDKRNDAKPIICRGYNQSLSFVICGSEKSPH